METKLKICVLAETKNESNLKTKQKFYFVWENKKIVSLAWENNYRYIFTYGNKAMIHIYLNYFLSVHMILGIKQF